MGFSKLGVPFFGGGGSPKNNCCILFVGSILGSPYSRKLPNSYQYTLQSFFVIYVLSDSSPVNQWNLQGN